MPFISKEHYFSNGWDCCKCGKMTEHRKVGTGVNSKLVCLVCGS